MRIGEKIKRAREARGLSQEGLARAVGISQPAIKKIESGETERSRFLPDLLAYLEIDGSISRPQSTPGLFPIIPAEVPIPVRSEMPLDVPVYGTVRGGPAGGFIYEGGIVDYVRRLPGITNAKDVFAVRVEGDSMEPAFREGTLIIVDPRRPPRIGDDVVIELKPNEVGEYVQGCVKRLVRRTPTKIVVEQFNPPRNDIEFDIDEVKAVFRVLTMDELIGI